MAMPVASLIHVKGAVALAGYLVPAAV
jgi:hypothetical protein